MPKHATSIERTRTLLRSAQRTPDAAISDYLRAIDKYAKSKIEQTIGLEGVAFRHMLTVPAAWPDNAREHTFDIATNANIGPWLDMISEPEAASCYVLRTLAAQDMVGPGDLFTVCDAGGGTIDVVTHEIVSLSPFKVKEVVPPVGALGGGTFIDQAFLEFVKTRIGEDPFKVIKDNPELSHDLVEKFRRHVKGLFPRKNKSQLYNVLLNGVPDSPEAGVEKSMLYVNHEDVEKLYEPELNKIYKLLDNQLEAVRITGRLVKEIHLVGGLGSSEYILEHLKSNYSDIIIRHTPHSATAVVRGGILAATQHLITTRVASQSYGVICRVPFDGSKHHGKRKHQDRFEGLEVQDHIRWFIKRGEDLPANAPVKHSFYDTFDTNEALPETYEVLFVSSDKHDPPERFRETSKTRLVCTLIVDLREIEATCELVETVTMKYRKVSFELSVQISGRVVFALVANDRMIKHIVVKYEEARGENAAARADPDSLQDPLPKRIPKKLRKL